MYFGMPLVSLFEPTKYDKSSKMKRNRSKDWIGNKVKVRDKVIQNVSNKRQEIFEFELYFSQTN